MKAQEEERRRREEEEEEKEKRKREEEQERKRKEEEEEEEEQRRSSSKEEQERGEQQQVLVAQRPSELTTYRALYSFVARNADELSIDADGLIEVDEQTVGEPGWFCGSYQGNRGWFPQSYAEKCPTPSTTETTAPSSPGKSSRPPPPPLNTRVPDKKVACDSTVPARSDASQSSVPLLARAVSSWSATSETNLNLASGTGDVITAMLSFSQGDVIGVLQQREDWWLGQLNGTQGWFPKSYVALETGGSTEYEDTQEYTHLSDANFKLIVKLY